MFEGWTVHDLKHAIWLIMECGSIARGGYPLEWYENELHRRTGCEKGRVARLEVDNILNNDILPLKEKLEKAYQETQK